MTSLYVCIGVCDINGVFWYMCWNIHMYTLYWLWYTRLVMIMERVREDFISILQIKVQEHSVFIGIKELSVCLEVLEHLILLRLIIFLFWSQYTFRIGIFINSSDLLNTEFFEIVLSYQVLLFYNFPSIICQIQGFEENAEIKKRDVGKSKNTISRNTELN